MDTALEAGVELALATTTRKHLSLDHELVRACPTFDQL
jgi:hypothetical protein